MFITNNSRYQQFTIFSIECLLKTISNYYLHILLLLDLLDIAIKYTISWLIMSFYIFLKSLNSLWYSKVEGNITASSYIATNNYIHSWLFFWLDPIISRLFNFWLNMIFTSMLSITLWNLFLFKLWIFLLMIQCFLWLI